MIRIPHITREQTHPDVERPYLPLLVVRPADLHPFPIRSYGVALLLDTSLPADDRLGTSSPARVPLDTPLPAKAALDALIRGDRPFLILLGPQTTEDLFEYIALCLFSPNYIRIGDAPVIAFHPSPPAGLITRLQQQGWSDIVQWNVPPIHRLTQRREIPDITDTLLTGASISKYIFIHGKDLDETLSLEQTLHRHCSNMLNDNPSLQALIKQKRQLQDALDTMEKENRTLRERLQNAETTVDIIRSKYKGDYDILFNWYQQEYEVLPLWYKRFGHLIKVLAGRRTVKSLLHSIHRRFHHWKVSSRRMRRPPSGPGGTPSIDPQKTAT